MRPVTKFQTIYTSREKPSKKKKNRNNNILKFQDMKIEFFFVAKQKTKENIIKNKIYKV